MNKSELLELIKTGEGYTIELKESLNSSIGKEICAFANASGGETHYWCQRQWPNNRL